MSARFSIGIDLGTTNSVVAYRPLGDDTAAVSLLPIPQIVAPGTVEALPALPSFLHLGTPEENKAAAFDLPWAKGRDFAAGEYARRHAAEVPARAVAAAKSWLCHSKVDRREPILPWESDAKVTKVSPVEASRRYLEQMAGAWAKAFPDAPLAQQHLVLTVPASFDASARDLTREAAVAAGLPKDFVLLEEPQAALYAWLDGTPDWRSRLREGDSLLVCDIGGGTTDFSLIRVTSGDGELALERVAVGNHILVGGDNMDLTLAHLAATEFAAKGVDVDAWQSVALWHSCRLAKEAVLAEGDAPSHPVVIPGRGSKLVGGTVKIDLNRELAASTLLDGFFPACALGEAPEKRRASGFREIGLPFESDAAITKHLAYFLSQHADAQPTHVLFNGGVLKSGVLRQRLLDVIQSWFGGRPPEPLTGNDDLDFAVARGAAYYGAAKTGKGIRIRGGIARSYYVGIETAGLAIPGAARPMRALCVAPFGMEEGTSAEVPGEEIGVVVGEPSRFRFFSSAVRQSDQPGDVVRRWADDELVETDSLEACLPAAEGEEEGIVPVRFESRVTELGVLELWCASTVSDERWKLEFGVRDSK